MNFTVRPAQRSTAHGERLFEVECAREVEGSTGAGEEGLAGVAAHEGGAFQGAMMTSNVLSELQVRPPSCCLHE